MFTIVTTHKDVGCQALDGRSTRTETVVAVEHGLCLVDLDNLIGDVLCRRKEKKIYKKCNLIQRNGTHVELLRIQPVFAPSRDQGLLVG